MDNIISFSFITFVKTFDKTCRIEKEFNVCFNINFRFIKYVSSYQYYAFDRTKILFDFTMKLIIHPISSKYLYFIALKCIFKQLIYGSIFQLAMYHAWHTTTFNQYKKKYYNNCLEAISFRVIYKITTLFNYNRLLQDYRSTCNFPFQDTVYTMLCITGCIGKEHFSNACHK